MNAKKNRTRQRLLALGIHPPGRVLPAQTTSVSGDSTINQCETKVLHHQHPEQLRQPPDQYDRYSQARQFDRVFLCHGNRQHRCQRRRALLHGKPDPFRQRPGLEYRYAMRRAVHPEQRPTLHVTFSLVTGCSAVSGSLNVRIDYESAAPPCSMNGRPQHPGPARSRDHQKTPNVIPQEIGQNVTWTLTIENTGFGTIKNVVVSDLLGAGLAYVSSVRPAATAARRRPGARPKFPCSPRWIPAKR